ncbi:MAG: hypothetical protein N3G76_00805 [Candidatus Micrarchaeota archaeon]|nr:hypothetical protein [Candidatus Micrarchaeota archaeon]
MPKMRTGWITFTCSEDSTIVFLELLNKNFFDWSERMEFVYCNALKKSGDVLKVRDVDVFFVEGAISTEDEKRKLEHIRSISKYVVAIGACACTGMPSSQRNFFDERTKSEITPRLEKFCLFSEVQPITKFIKVDDMVMGCPMDEKAFVRTLGKYFGIFKV